MEDDGHQLILRLPYKLMQLAALWFFETDVCRFRT
jgi:hypothetical protein